MREVNPLNHAQMLSAIKGHDRYHRIRPRARREIKIALGWLAAVLIFFASLFVIAEFLGHG